MNSKFILMAKKIANEISNVSEDPYAKVGSVVLNKDGRILSVGYNGLAPKKNVTGNFWLDRDHRRNFMIHAEMNALSCISRYDNPYAIYINLSPCTYCANLIASYGIKEVYYTDEYSYGTKANEVFKFYNIKYRRIV